MNWSQIKHFTEAEFACKHCGECKMDETFVKRLDMVRGKLGFPISINSGYRCPEHNDAVSSTGLAGPHTTGKAADLSLSYTGARKALTTLSETFNGLGLKQKGDGRFIHVDDLQPRIWTY